MMTWILANWELILGGLGIFILWDWLRVRDKNSVLKENNEGLEEWRKQMLKNIQFYETNEERMRKEIEVFKKDQSERDASSTWIMRDSPDTEPTIYSFEPGSKKPDEDKDE